MKKILLFSGGLDCFVLWWLNKGDPNLSWLHLSRMSHHSTAAVYDLIKDERTELKNNGFIHGSITADDVNTEYEGFMLCCIAAAQHEADIVYVAFNEEDNDPDGMDVVLSEWTYFASRCRGKLVQFQSPFRGISKIDVVKKALGSDCPEDLLLKTWSCNGQPKEKIHCGECRNCVERKVAFVMNNMNDKFLKDPFKSDYAKHVLKFNEDDYPYKKRLVEAIHKSRKLLDS